VTTAASETIPLHPRRRLIGTASGGSASIRRGGRSDVASSRPYRPGDHFRTIDWKASARLSSAQNHDEFIVRERHADEMPAVVIVVDRRPGMALYPAELPWLHKPEAVRAVVDILVASAVNQRSLVGYLDHTTWQPPRAQASVWSQGVEERIDEHLADGFDAPDDALDRALEDLALRRPSLPIGSFVFVVSDFLQPVPHERWSRAVTRGWDVIPVIVQDPVWEQSFPEIDGVLVTVTDAIGGHEGRVRLGPREVAERRASHEQRLTSIQDDFVRLGLDPILIGSTDHVHERLLEWARARIDIARGPR
jgi:uncharacterized protein (DUF58 family)